MPSAALMKFGPNGAMIMADTVKNGTDGNGTAVDSGESLSWGDAVDQWHPAVKAFVLAAILFAILLLVCCIAFLKKKFCTRHRTAPLEDDDIRRLSNASHQSANMSSCSNGGGSGVKVLHSKKPPADKKLFNFNIGGLPIRFGKRKSTGAVRRQTVQQTQSAAGASYPGIAAGLGVVSEDVEKVGRVLTLDAESAHNDVTVTPATRMPHAAHNDDADEGGDGEQQDGGKCEDVASEHKDNVEYGVAA